MWGQWKLGVVVEADWGLPLARVVTEGLSKVTVFKLMQQKEPWTI